MRRLLPEPADALNDSQLAAAYAYPRAAAASPWLRANMVTSLDGAASVNGRTRGLSGPADQRILRLLRGLADVVLVGAGTVRTEGYGPLAVSAEHAASRAASGQRRAPVLAIVSARLDLDPGARAFAPVAQRPVVLTVASAPAERVAALREVAEVAVAGEQRVQLSVALDVLAGHGLTRGLCEGGPALLHEVITAGRLDELCLSLSPRLVGGEGPRLLAGPLAAAPLGLGLRHVLSDEDFLFLRYQRQSPSGGPDEGAG